MKKKKPTSTDEQRLTHDRRELIMSPLKDEGYPWRRLRVNLPPAVNDDPFRVLWNILNLDQATVAEPKANWKAEHSNDYSSYMDIVDFSYFTLCTRDPNFASHVTLSMYVSFCVQLLYLRLNEINAASGKPYDEKTVSFSEGMRVELPDTVARHLLALGNFWSPDGVFYGLAQPHVEELLATQNGSFGRIDHKTISRYQENPAPLVAWASVAADVAVPHTPLWNLPSLVKPTLPAGMYVKPTVSCLGWQRSSPPCGEALQLYSLLGITKGKIPRDAFGPFQISPNSLALISKEIQKVKNPANIGLKFGCSPVGTFEQLWSSQLDELPVSGTRATRLRCHIESPMEVTDINFAGLVCPFKILRYEGTSQLRRYVLRIMRTGSLEKLRLRLNSGPTDIFLRLPVAIFALRHQLALRFFRENVEIEAPDYYYANTNANYHAFDNKMAITPTRTKYVMFEKILPMDTSFEVRHPST